MLKYIKSKILGYEIVFYLSTGKSVIVKCKNFEISKLSGKGSEWKYLLTDCNFYAFSIDLDEVVSYTARVCFFFK